MKTLRRQAWTAAGSAFRVAALLMMPGMGIAGAQTNQAVSAYSFTDSVGMVTHFAYADTVYYKQYGDAIALLHRLNIHHIRDGLWMTTWKNSDGIHSGLLKAGIGLDLVTPNPGQSTMDEMVAKAKNVPEVEAIEAPNEYDQAGGPGWAAALRAYMPAVAAVGAATNLPVIGPSFTRTSSFAAVGNIGQYVAYNNFHAYWGARNPETSGWGGPNAQHHNYGSVDYDLDQCEVVGPGLPTMFTETGYLASTTLKKNVIPESVEAIYVPRLLLHLFNKGVKRSYLYELADERSSPKGFGIFQSDLTPRPAAVALENLMKVLHDWGPAAKAYKPGSVNYTLTGATPAIETTFLGKSDGSFVLAIWNNSAMWETNEVHPLEVAPTPVKITISGRSHSFDGYWTLDDSGAMNLTHISGKDAVVNVGSGVSLVRIRADRALRPESPHPPD